MKLNFILVLFLLSHATELIKIPLFDKSSEKKELNNGPKQSQLSQKEIAIDLRQKPANVGLYTTWRRIPNIFEIIFSFLGGDLIKIINLAPSKGWVEVIFRHLIRKSLKKENYIAPTKFWKNALDLQTIQIEIFNDQQIAFVRNDFQELQLQADIETLAFEIRHDFVGGVTGTYFKLYTLLVFLFINTIAGVSTYAAKISDWIGAVFVFSTFAAVFYFLNFVVIYIFYNSINRRNQKKKLEEILKIIRKN